MSRFDPAFYLARNTDVALAVARGAFTARQHFDLFGAREGRDPSAFFDTRLYLQQNPDVAAAVAAGTVTAFAHHATFGRVEGRTASAVFTPALYIQANPDVAAAVASGAVTAWDHFVAFGMREGRSLGNGISLATFAQDPVFTGAIVTGQLETAFDRIVDIAIFTPGFTPPSGTDLTALWQRYGATIPNDWVGPATAAPLAVPTALTLPAGTTLGAAFAARTDPVVVSVSAPNGEYRIGQTIPISVTFDQPVVVTVGSAELGPFLFTLNGPGSAPLTGGSGTNVLTFAYTWAGPQLTFELDYANTAALSVIPGSTVRSLSGRNAVLTLPEIGSAKSLSGTSDVYLDGQAPAPTLTAAAFASNASTLTLTGSGFTGFVPFGTSSGEILSRLGSSGVSIDFNNDGTADASLGAASFSSASVTSNTSMTLTLTSATSTALSGVAGFGAGDGVFDRVTLLAGFASDVAGNTSTASGSVVATTGSVATIGVSQLASPTPSAQLGIGQSATVTVKFGGAVTVSGTPTLALSSGGTATYASGTGTDTLSFTYTVASGQNSADLDAGSTSALALSGGSISDQFGRAAVLTVPTGASTGALAAGAAITVDGVRPEPRFQGLQYLAASDRLLIDGSTMQTMLGRSERADPTVVDFRSRIDISKLAFDLTKNGVDGSDARLTLASLTSASLSLDGTLLTIQLTGAAATALEAQLTANPTYSIVIENGFGRDQALNAATSDAVVGNFPHDNFLALGGNDTLDGGGGRDTLDGGADNDSIIAGSGSDTLTGGTGADRFVVSTRETITDYQVGVDNVQLQNGFFTIPATLPGNFQGQAVNPTNTLAVNLATLTQPTLTSNQVAVFAISGTDVTFSPANLDAIETRIAELTTIYSGNNRTFYFVSNGTDTRIFYDTNALVADFDCRTVAILQGVSTLPLSDFSIG